MNEERGDFGDLNEILDMFRVEKRRIALEFERKMENYRRESDPHLRAMKLLENKLRPAATEDYKQWLAGYLRSGKKPTHSYDYPMSNVLDRFRIALDSFEITPLCGADALHIIVPKDVNFLGGELGHTQLYFMDGFQNQGGWIPVYTDIKF